MALTNWVMVSWVAIASTARIVDSTAAETSSRRGRMNPAPSLRCIGPGLSESNEELLTCANATSGSRVSQGQPEDAGSSYWLPVAPNERVALDNQDR